MIFLLRKYLQALVVGFHVEQRTVTVDGIAIHCRIAGGGRPLLLLHGLLANGQTWRRNVAALANHSTVYAIDLFNMGKSERVAGLDAGLEATADRLSALMDELGLDVADVAGHSHGGAIAMMLAARHPNRIGKMVLFAPANPFCPHGARSASFFATPLGGWLGRRIPIWPRMVQSVALRRMYGDPTRVTKDTLEFYTDHLSIPGTMDYLLDIVRGWKRDMRRLRSVLNKLTNTPALLIWGDMDRAVSLPSATLLQKALGGAELMVIPGVGHLPFEEQPEICNRAVSNWLHS